MLLTVFFNFSQGKEEYVLAVGNTISLVSASGSVLANADVLGGVVISLPTIADFNNDGLNDIIISTPNAYAATPTTIASNWPYLLFYVCVGTMDMLCRAAQGRCCSPRC